MDDEIGPVGSVAAMQPPSLSSLLAYTTSGLGSLETSTAHAHPSLHENEESSSAASEPRRKRRAAAQAAMTAIHLSSPSSRRSTDPSVAAAAAAVTSLESEPYSERPSKRPRRAPTPGRKKPPPNAKNDADYEDDNDEPIDKKEEGALKDNGSKKEEETHSCVICMSAPDPKDLAKIDGCEHTFCFDCISEWSSRENKCPLCKTRFSQIKRVVKSKKGKNGKRQANSKRVKTRDQRSDFISGAAVEAMLSSIAAGTQASGLFGGGSAFARYLESLGGGPTIAGIRTNTTNRRHNPRAGAARAVAAPSAVARNIFESDDDSDGSDFSEYMRQTMMMSRSGSRPRAAASTASSRVTFPSGSQTTSVSFTFALPSVAQASTTAAAAAPARSYAANGGDSEAGRNLDNPLEIEDSDDDDDDEVIIIDPPSTTP